MQKNRNFFCKYEKICSNKEKEQIFSSNNKKFFSPFFCRYLFLDNNDYFLKIIIIVPKKKVRKANKRNLVKRLIKEAYRLNNSILKENLKRNNKFLLLSLSYTVFEILTYKEIENSLVEIFNFINNKINSENKGS